MSRVARFTIDELRAEIEQRLGFRLESLVRMGGASSLNFKAVRAADGYVFLVKCTEFSRRRYSTLLVDHLAVLDGSLASRRIFADKESWEFGGCDLICLEWCDGEVMFPDQLTDQQFDAFLLDYLEFSKALQRVSTFCDTDQFVEWRRETLHKCRGVSGWLIKKLLSRVSEADLIHAQGSPMAIHGDFHHGNILFRNGRLSGVFDLEEIRIGHPTDDIVRYIICASEHLHWYEIGRRRMMVRRFARAVGVMPYPKDAWRVAVNGRFIYRMHMRTYDVAVVGLAKALNLLFRSFFYRRLLNCLEKL